MYDRKKRLIGCYKVACEGQCYFIIVFVIRFARLMFCRKMVSLVFHRVHSRVRSHVMEDSVPKQLRKAPTRTIHKEAIHFLVNPYYQILAYLTIYMHTYIIYVYICNNYNMAQGI